MLYSIFQILYHLIPDTLHVKDLEIPSRFGYYIKWESHIPKLHGQLHIPKCPHKIGSPQNMVPFSIIFSTFPSWNVNVIDGRIGGFDMLVIICIKGSCTSCIIIPTVKWGCISTQIYPCIGLVCSTDHSGIAHIAIEHQFPGIPIPLRKNAIN